jgi:hypothetical protein
VLQRVQEGHLLHEVRRELLQVQPAFLQGLGDEPEVEHLQVAQAAVHELAGPARRARREVARLDQTDRETAGGGVEGGAGADDSSPDDQDVERGGLHRVEGGLTGVGRERDGAHASSETETPPRRVLGGAAPGRSA